MRPLTLEAEVHEIAAGGDGVAICTIDGERRAVFVPGALAGERVRVVVDPKGRPARGRLVDVLAPSEARVVPSCRHVERCGGCDWMFLSAEGQADAHAKIVAKLLGTTVPVKVHPAPRPLGYRSRARVHVEAKRGRVTVGMFGRKTHEPVAVDTCIVLDPVLDRARAALSGWLEGASGRGEAQLALGHPEGSPRLAVFELRWKGDLPGEVFGRLERAVRDRTLGGARIFAGEVRAPATIGDATPWVRGADGAPLRLAPGGFSQATEDGNELLGRRVAEHARLLRPGPCVELYSGAGNLTVMLARDRELVAVENVGDACEAARQNLATRGLSARVVDGDASAFPIPKATALVVLDPPREGARAVASALAARPRARSGPSIVYVACDPPTLARDVRVLLEGGYRIRAVETFELFPQTSHVETLVVLTREPDERIG